MNASKLFSTVAGLSLLVPLLHAQPGSIDCSFNIGWGPTGDSPSTRAITLQPDGRILVAGHFTHFNNAPCSCCIARVNPDGTLDGTFGASILPEEPNWGYQSVNSLAIQSDGWILAGGNFETTNGAAYNSLVRLKPDGTTDTNFVASALNGSGFNSLALQPDNRILVATIDAGWPATSLTLLRLESNGQIDESFTPISQTNGIVEIVKCAPDGKIWFVLSPQNNNPTNALGRLLTDGTVDANFSPALPTPPSSISLRITDIEVQYTNKVIVSYQVQLTNYVTIGYWTRLNEDGSVDSSFNTLTGTNFAATAFCVLNDNNILTSGYFYDYLDNSTPFLEMLNTNGNIIDAYSALGSFNVLTPQSDGKILVLGSITTPDGVSVGLARLNGEGSANFTNEPMSLVLTQGSNATFSALATSSTPFSYQWTVNGSILPNQTNQLLQLVDIEATNVGTYTLLASNGFGVVSSQPATLTISPQATAPGAVDIAFVVSTNISSVYSLALQADGKIIVGEESGPTGRTVDRLNSDGSVDQAFVAPTGPMRTTRFLGLYADGRIVQGGWYGAFDQGLFYTPAPEGFLDRISSAGILDSSFSPSLGSGGALLGAGLQSDGKVIVGGTFTNVNQTAVNSLVRLNLDSTIDTSFNPALSPGDEVEAVAIQPDGKVLLAGQFWDSGYLNLIRLNPDGSLDQGFAPTSLGGIIYDIALQNDGRIVVVGWFSEVQGVSCRGFTRLNADGTIDSTFQPGIGVGEFDSVLSVACQSNGKILIGGFFEQVNQIPCGNIVRLNYDGSVDLSFNAGEGTDFSVWSIAVDPQGKVLCGGSSPGLVRFFGGESNVVSYIPNITLQPTNVLAAPGASAAFNIGVIGAPPLFFQWRKDSVNLAGQTNTVLSLPNVGTGDSGRYSAIAYNDLGAATSVVAQLVVQIPAPIFLVQPQSQTNTIGSSVTFNPYVTWATSYQWLFNGNLLPGATNPTLVLPNIQLTGAGAYSLVASNQTGVSVSSNAMLSVSPAPANSASLDVYFYPGSGADGTVECFAPQSDGKILIGGLFRHVNGVPLQGIARLNADGTVDGTFNPGSGVDGGVQAIAIQADGRVLVGGNFQHFNGQLNSCLVRLLSNGSLDSSFAPANGANAAVTSIAIQPDTSIIVAGAFTSLDGTLQDGVGRLYSDGSLDLSFDPGTGPDNAVQCVALQPDGKILLGGLFLSVDGYPQNHICRLNADGSLDVTFGSGTISPGTDKIVRAMVIQTNGFIVIGGDFSAVNGVATKALARLDQRGLLDRSLSLSITTSGSSFWVNCLALRLNNKLLLGGSFTSINGIPLSRVAQIGANGTPDPLFSPGSGANGTIYALTLGQCDRLYVGGSFTTFNAVPRSGLARLYGDNPCPPAALQIATASHATEIGVTGDPGRQYQLMISPDLRTWGTSTNFTGTGTVLWLTNPPPQASPHLFYRSLLMQ